MTARARYGFHEQLPVNERLLLDILNGEHDPKRETPEQTAVIQKWISEIEEDLKARKRVRRTPAERAQRKSQRRIGFRKRLSL